jgi:hypothetical protein
MLAATVVFLAKPQETSQEKGSTNESLLSSKPQAVAMEKWEAMLAIPTPYSDYNQR